MTKRKVFAYNGPDLLDCHELEPLLLGGKNRRFAPFTFQTPKRFFPLLPRAAVRILYLLLEPTEVVLCSEHSISANPNGRQLTHWETKVRGTWIPVPWTMPRPDGRAIRMLLRKRLLREDTWEVGGFRYTLTDSGKHWIDTFLENPTPPPYNPVQKKTEP